MYLYKCTFGCRHRNMNKFSSYIHTYTEAIPLKVPLKYEIRVLDNIQSVKLIDLNGKLLPGKHR